ncbi:MAG: gliding motility-associated C-terminal domain-containing protein, partial [Flavobacteriales bacterium]
PDAEADGTWSAGNGSYDPAVDNSGTFTFTVSGGVFCADAQASIEVTETLAMNAGADSTITLCGNGTALDLSTLLNGADANGSWSNGSGQYDPIADDPGTIMYIVAGSGQCPSDTAFFTVPEQTPPNAGSSAGLTVCSNGSPVNLFTALGGSPDNGGQWSRSDGTFTDGTFDPSTDVAGSFTYTVDAIAPCSAASSTIIVSVADAPSAAWSSPSALCNAAQPIDLSNTVSGESGGNWSGPGIAPDGQHFDPSSLAPQGNSEDYTITYTVTVDGCTSAQSGAITVMTSPVANAGTDGEECGLEHELAAGLNSGSGLWSAAAGITFNEPEAPGTMVHVAGPGTYAMRWTVTNGPCSATDTVMITFHLPEELTLLDAGPDQEQNISRSALLNGVADGATELHWSVISGSGSIAAPDGASSGIDGLSIGTNLILLSARVGTCPYESDTTAITVRDLFIPSGFSPNGDGVNDTFEVIGIDVYPGNELTVFNRYGQQVFHAAGYANGWDGKDGNSKELADGTYFYVLSITAEETYHGQVILKR